MKKVAETHSKNPILFNSILPKSFSFTLVHAGHFEHLNEQFIQLQLETDMTTLTEILDKKWFNLSPSVVLQPAHFTDEAPVIIKIVLSPAITAQILEQSYELEHILGVFYNVNTGVSDLVTQQENWFLVEAKQLQNISEQFEPDRHQALYIGFKTSWYSLLVEELILERKPIIAEKPDGTLKSDVISMLQQEGIAYSYDDINSAFYIQLKEQAVEWTEVIRIDEEKRAVTCYANFPNPVPQNQLDKIALIIVNENYSLSEGSFELDYEDGDLRFRSSFLALEQLDDRVLAHVLTEHAQAMFQYIPAINQYLTNNQA